VNLFLEQQILQFISNIYLQIQWPGVVVLMAIESACIPLPSEIIMPLAGWLLIKNLELPASYILLAGLYGAIGNVIGSLVAYAVGMWGGRPFLERWGKYILISHYDLDRADRWFKHYGSWSIFISRLLPAVRTFISLPAGIARMNLIKFIVYSFIGSFIWSLALAYGGYQIGEHWEQIRAVMRPFDYLIIGIILALIGYYIYRHVRRYNRDKASKQG
jgi:membrane protein DedA with SNARE-associated domain